MASSLSIKLDYEPVMIWIIVAVTSPSNPPAITYNTTKDSEEKQ